MPDSHAAIKSLDAKEQMEYLTEMAFGMQLTWTYVCAPIMGHAWGFNIYREWITNPNLHEHVRVILEKMGAIHYALGRCVR